jgi:predicted DNA-binding transcriptional regulator YafY
VGGARTDLTGLTAAEARALFLLVGPAAPNAPALRSALAKLVQALPGTFRADAEAAARAVVVDPVPWGGREPARHQLVERLQDAVVRRRRVRLDYAGRTRERTRRLVDPWGLVDKAGIWYLVAGTDAGRRTFRVDRIVEATVTDVPAERPADLELPEAWQHVVDDVEARRSLVSAVVTVEARFVRVLRDQFGRHCHHLPAQDADGRRARVRLLAPTALAIAQQLAGWGTQIDVVDGVEGGDGVRAELARIGRELVERYDP